MNTLDLVNAIRAGDSRKTQEVFETLTAEKIETRIGELRTQVAQNMFGAVEESVEAFSEEEFQALDEETKKGLTKETKVVAKGTRPKGIGWSLHSAGEQTGKETSTYIRHTKPHKVMESVELTEEEQKYEDMSDDEFESLVEGIDQLDELTKATLGSYIKKATSSNGMASFRQGKALGNAGAFSKRPDKEAASANAKISDKRTAGIHKAVKKLTA